MRKLEPETRVMSTIGSMRKANQNYKSKFDNANIRMPKGTKKAIEDNCDCSFNEYVNRLIASDLERRNIIVPAPSDDE